MSPKLAGWSRLPDLHVLALDSTGPDCTVALVNDSVVIAARRERIGRGHAERLAPMTQEVLDMADLKISDLTRIAACTGPGSFTGLRAALSFARALALPSRLPVIGISSLEVWAAQRDPKKTKMIASVADVRRGELCWAIYKCGQEIQPPRTDNIDTVKAVVLEYGVDEIAGSGAKLISREAEAQPIRGPVLAWLAFEKNSVTNPPNPLYSRLPDAKLPGGLDPARL